MGQQRLLATQVQPEVLASAPGRVHVATGQPGGEVQLTGDVAAYRAGMAHFDGGHGTSGDVLSEA
jgi:hypothetical protein